MSAKILETETNFTTPVSLPTDLQPLIELPHWIVWKLEPPTKRGKKWKKNPYQVRDPSRLAENDNPATWATYDQAVAVVAAGKATGIGFALTGTKYRAFDLDDCRNKETGAIVIPKVQTLIDQANSYTEVSVSGDGVHIIGIGTDEKKRVHLKRPRPDGGLIEIYRNTNVFLYMSGQQIGSAGLADIDDLIDQTVVELDGKSSSKTTDYSDEEDKLQQQIRDGESGRYGGHRAKAEWSVINEMFRRGYMPATIKAVLLDRKNGISAKVYDEKNPEKYVVRQINKAWKQLKLAIDEESGKPYITQDNIRLALAKLKITLRYDQFADRTLITGLDEFGPVLDDPGMTRLRLTMDMRFKLFPGKSIFTDVITDTARRNGFHPVRDYLDGLHWDGVKRVDTWLTTYTEAEDNEYTRAVGRLMLTAAVRRVRQPGCKFDEMVVFETPKQGTDKSSALKELSVNDEWFLDDLPLNVEGKQVIEMIRGKWIVECAELSGLRRGDIEHVKALLSRQTDRGRLVWDRLTSEVKRQCILTGSTNSSEWLKDLTGNRRFWPVLIKQFDLVALKRDRDQLWAEAAALEAAGVSIRLDPSLYPVAAEEQEKRLTRDPYLEVLHNVLGDMEGKIKSVDVWEILDIKAGYRTQEHNRRMGEAMRQLGWGRRNSAGTISVHSRNVVGYVRGDEPHRLIVVKRDLTGGVVAIYETEPPPPEEEPKTKTLTMKIHGMQTHKKRKGARTMVQVSCNGKSDWLPETALTIGPQQADGRFEITMSETMAERFKEEEDASHF